MTRARSAGFTLIEVVVAFVLLSTVLALGFEIFSDGLRRTGELDDRSRAVIVAQSRLASAGLEEPLAEGQSQGESEDRRYRWTLTVTRNEAAEGPPNQPISSAYVLYRVEARVEWTGGDQRPRTYSMATMRLGPRPA
jgi:general secretion pathway protein I